MGQKSSKKVFKRTPGYSIQEGGADPELQHALYISSKESEKKGGFFHSKKEKPRVVDDKTKMNAADAAEARMSKLKNQQKSLSEKRTEKIEKMVQFAAEKAQKEHEKIQKITTKEKDLQVMIECPFSCEKKFSNVSELELHIQSSHPEIDLDGLTLTEEDAGIEIDFEKYPDVTQSSIESFQTSLSNVQKNNAEESITQAMKAIALILSNMTTATTEVEKQKYFKIRTQVPYVQKTILSVNGAKELLFTVGFQLQKLVCEKSGVEEEYYVYPDNKSIDYVKLAAEYLRQAYK